MDSVSSSDDGNWNFGGQIEDASSTVPGVRKHSLRNITPRSYSSLLKSESEEEEEEKEQELQPTKLSVKPNVTAAGNQGIYNFVSLSTAVFLK